ncbi:MAG: hypothetical protein J6C45_02900 [Alistipes sp.]|nr:hypothetical protein [Alistipes sp.]
MAKVIKKAPASDSPKASANDKRQLFDKDSINILPRQQRRILLFLLTSTRPVSVVDIIRSLGQTDPRGHISRLRRRGYPISHIKCQSKEGYYYFRYFIRKEVEDGR